MGGERGAEGGDGMSDTPRTCNTCRHAWRKGTHHDDYGECHDCETINGNPGWQANIGTLERELADARRQVAICVSALTRVRDWNDQEEADDQGQLAARALAEARKGATA